MNKYAKDTVVSKILRTGIPGLIAALVVFLLYRDQFIHYWQEWNRSNGYYSHGILVPLIAAYMVWANRKRLADSVASPTWLGVILILPAIPIYLFGKWTGSGFLIDASLMLVVFGAVWSFTGNKIIRILAFPIIYLIFMMPLPGTVLDEATMRIQTQSTHLASAILNITGYASEIIGSNEIHSSYLPGPLVVGVACSGFKLLISLITFTAFFVYMLQTSPWKKAIIIVFAVPLSVFINSLRIAMIGYVGIWVGTMEAMHKFHDYSGYLGLVICFVILFGFAKLIKANRFGFDDSQPSMAENINKEHMPYKTGKCAPAVIALLIMLAFGMTITPLEVTAKGILPRNDISTGFDNWSSRDIPIAESVAKELKSAGLMQRVFTNVEDGREIELFMEAARDTDAFHNPMMCIPGSGSGISDKKTIILQIKKPKPMRIKASLLKVCGVSGQEGYIIHWYMIGTNTFPTTSDIRGYMRILQVKDMYNTIKKFSKRNELREDLKKRQAYWYRFYTSSFDAEESDVAFLKSFIIKLIERNPSFGEK